MRKKLVSLMLALCLLPLGSLAEVEVVASLFPQFDFARAIAGERAHVSQLLPPGQDSHGYEPSMRELLALGEADLFLFTGEAMEPWAASLVGGMEDGPAIVDVSAGVSAESGHEAAEGGNEHSHDAHIWLNPLNAITMCENIRDALIGIDPEGEAVYRANAEALIADLTALDEAFRAVHIAEDLLKSDNPPRAILFETALHGELLNLDEEDNKRHYAGGMSANRINAGLGTIISQLLESCGREKIAGLYTTGGDTMVNVCYQLGVECIEVMDYVIPQTDIGRLVGSYDGLPIVGKGGLTGNDNTACDIVERLFRESARK